MKRIIFFSYGCLILVILAFSYLFIDPNLSYLKIFYSGFFTTYRQYVTGIYVLIVIFFYIIYFFLLKLFHEKHLNVKDLKILLCINIILIVSYPTILSYDIFNYLLTSKVTFFYQENPYIIPPIEFIDEPWNVFTHAANKTALYGPVWIVITAIPFILGKGNFLLALFLMKILITVFYFFMIFLLWKLTKNIFSLVLFSFNPLVIIETLIGAHNDVVMMFFALLALYFLSKKKHLFSALFFLFSVLIKFATIILLPIYTYVFWKNIKKERVDYNQIFFLSFIAMVIVFFFSPFREEIYPWYAIWFLVFIPVLRKKRKLLWLTFIFSFSLLLRYIPFMLTGMHHRSTPSAKIILTFFPLTIFFIGYIIFKLYTSYKIRHYVTQIKDYFKA